MANFSYKAVRRDGVVIKGDMEALHILDLESRLEKTGCELISAKAKSTGFSFMQKNITRRDLIDFFVYMEQMILAGVPIVEALDDFKQGLEPSELKNVVSDLCEKIQSGSTLSAAMESSNKVFSSLMIELVKVGEQSGLLATIFGEIKDALKWQDELITQTKKIIMYPAFVGAVVFGVLCFMMIYLVPQMVGFIANMGGELPFHTKLLMAVSDIFVNYWYLIISTPIVIFVATKITINKSPAARLWFDRNVLKLPGLGSVLKKIILARFASNFALLYRSGIGVLEGLKITRGVVGNTFVAKEIDFIHEQVTEGVGISDAFARTQLFPQLVMRMIRVGEQTGGLDKSLVNVSYFFNRDVEDAIEKLQSMIEPAMTVILGLILGWVMMSVLGPIYDLIGNMEL
jgi:type IV pilus assembly protein PilC